MNKKEEVQFWVASVLVLSIIVAILSMVGDFFASEREKLPETNETNNKELLSDNAEIDKPLSVVPKK